MEEKDEVESYFKSIGNILNNPFPNEKAYRKAKEAALEIMEATNARALHHRITLGVQKVELDADLFGRKPPVPTRYYKFIECLLEELPFGWDCRKQRAFISSVRQP